MPYSQKNSKNNLFIYITITIVLVSFVTPKTSNGFSLELIHMDFSQFNPQALRIQLNHDSVRYVVKLHLGTPAIPLYLLVDTGSNLLWTQCEPCTHRYHQVPPIYNSTASHTYLKLPCENPFCRNNNSTFKCVHHECVYKEQFGSGPITEGVAASDVLQTSDGNQMHIDFGCSKNNRNFVHWEHTGRTGGIMGLSMSPVSFLQQLANVTHRRFSYCLTPSRNVNASSFLRFGNDINTNGRRFQSTPIVSPPHKYHYYVHLQDVSVEGNRLHFPPNTFTLKRDGTGGCIIDSGTPLTRIIQPAYQQVIRAFQTHFDNQGLERVHAPRFDLCYKKSIRPFRLASVTYHFEGADLEVNAQEAYMLINNNEFCIALLPAQRHTILGSTHQVNTRFVFDAAARQILFSPENCFNDR